MAYQLRSRKDPASLESQEQTDTSEGNLAEMQVTTSGQTIVVPPQLSDTEQIALPVTEASPSQATLSASMKPETVSTSSVDFEGPIRFDPGLGSAAVSVGALLPADTVGPPSAVIAGHDATLIGSQIQQLDDTIDTSSLSLVHDSQEVKHTTPAGTTILTVGRINPAAKKQQTRKLFYRKDDRAMNPNLGKEEAVGVANGIPFERALVISYRPSSYFSSILTRSRDIAAFV